MTKAERLALIRRRLNKADEPSDPIVKVAKKLDGNTLLKVRRALEQIATGH